MIYLNNVESKSSGTERVEAIDSLTSLRGIAAWWVVFYHFREYLAPYVDTGIILFISKGYLAVDLFFILSGFVISYNYIHKFDELTISKFMSFLKIRLARVYPLHLFMLCLLLINPLAICLFAKVRVFGHGYDFAYFIMSILLVQNWGFTHFLAWNVPAWSISTEWFAYILFPAIAWISARHAASQSRALWAGALLISLLAAGSLAVGGRLGSDIPTFGLTRCVLEFCLGVCLFRIWAERKEGRGRYEGGAAFLVAVGCLAAYTAWPLPDAAVVPLGFASLIYALTDRRLIVARLLSTTVLRVIGNISYSTYLVHHLVKIWVMFLLVRNGIPAIVPFLAYIVVTALASFVLYHTVEMPGRRALRAATVRPWWRALDLRGRAAAGSPDPATAGAALGPPAVVLASQAARGQAGARTLIGRV